MEKERDFQWDDFSAGMSTGMLIIVMTVVLSRASGLLKDEPTPLIDCDNGIHNASFGLILQNSQSFSTESISGNRNISVEEDSDGKLIVHIHNNNSVVAHMPSGERIATTELQIRPETSVSLEDEQVIYDIKNIPNEKGSEVQINASCKN